MKQIGILLLINVVAVAGYFLFSSATDSKRIVAFASIGFAIGIGLIIGDRITGMKIPGVGELTAATERAIASADRIQKIEKEIEAHRDSIAMIVRDANEARKDIKNVEEASVKAEAKAKEAEKLVKEAHIAVERIKDVSDYSFIATKALNDDRAAFNQLISIATNPKSEYQKYALNTLVQIANDPQIIGMINTNQVDWSLIKVDPATASFEELRILFSEANISPLWRPDVLDTIWKATRFPIHDRIDLMCEVIRRHESIRCVAAACRLINQEAKKNKNILGFEEYLKWWDENRASYVAKHTN